MKYRDRALYTRYLVEPAGLRDIANDSSGRLIQDDINKLYGSLLMFTRSIPKGASSILYDPVRWQIQSKAQEIYEYIENFLDGKRGFIQGSFARRKVAMGTRNVITAAPMLGSSPEDPRLLGADDVMLGVYQTIKGLQSHTYNTLMTAFITPIFGVEGSLNIPLSDPKTKQLVYRKIDPSERDRWTTKDGVEKLINQFRNPAIRSQPAMVKDSEGKSSFLSMVYDDQDEIALCRSIEDLKTNWPRKINPEKLRGITWIELFYLVARTASEGKHAIITRYPVIEQGSSYPAKIHVTSTTPARAVTMVDLISGSLYRNVFDQYPVLGMSYMDAMMVHPSKLALLGGDRLGPHA